MHILLLTNLFQPEPNHLRGVSFATELKRRGHHVEVMTGFPIYPEGKVYDGYRMRWRMQEMIGDIPVTRVAMYPSHDSSAIRRTVTYLTHSLSSCLQMSYMRFVPDIVHVYLGPITLTWPAMILRALRGVPYVMDVADLWPESVSASGMLTNKWMINLLGRICDQGYAMSTKIIVPTEGFGRLIQDRGVEKEKIEFVPHWCDEENMLSSKGPDSILSKEIGFDGYFNIVYAGNIGKFQALGYILDAAKLTGEFLPQVRYVFIGGGVETQVLKERAEEEKIANVKFMASVPSTKIGRILALADVLLIHLKDDPLTRVTIPQKTQAYMAIGKPILMAVRGEAADLVRQAGAGLLCDPENPEYIADSVRRIFSMKEEERAEMGSNGRRFYEEWLSIGVGINRIESIYREVLATS